jgi:hypothetical protein
MPTEDSSAGDDLYHAVRTVIRRRKTSKVFASVERPLTIDATRKKQCDAMVQQSIEDAGWAPFHFDRHVDKIAEPWRVHWLQQSACRQIANQLGQWFTDLKPGNKMPSLLAACGCVVLVTWIPQTAVEGEDPQKLVGVNEEHLAATAAYVENLLLLLEAGGLASYWSSGGLFKSSIGFQKLGISADQRLLASVFVDYSPHDTARTVELAGGGQRANRSPSAQWTREIKID